MSESFEKTVAAIARDWSGVVPANSAAVAMGVQLAKTASGFVALRGTLVFEAEPAGFLSALTDTARNRE